MFRYVLLLTWALWAQTASAVNLNEEYHSLSDRAEVWVDESAQVRIADLQTGLAMPDWKVNKSVGNAYGFTQDAVWMRWRIYNGPDAQKKILWSSYSILQDVQIFVLDEFENISFSSRMGRNFSSSQNFGSRKQLAKVVEFPPGFSHLYVRIKTDTALKGRFSLLSPEVYAYTSEGKAFGSGFLLGMLLAGCGFYLLLGIALRAPALGLVALYFLQGAGFQGIIDGSVGVIWPTSEPIPLHILPPLLTGMGATILGYWILALKDQGIEPSRIPAVGVGVYSALTILMLFLPYEHAIRFAPTLNIFPWLYLMVSSVNAKTLNIAQRWPIFLSALVYLLGGGLLWLDSYGFAYFGSLSTSVYVLTAVPQILMLTFGVALFARERVTENQKMRSDLAQQMQIAADAKAETYAAERRFAQKYQQIEEGLESVRTEAMRDPLTGILNRAGLTERLDKLAQKDVTRVSMVVFDLDHFKRLNDDFGHAVGDDALVLVAKVIEQALSRPGDFIARFGGEEFIAVLPETGILEAESVAKRVLAAIKTEPFYVRDRRVTITASAGVAFASSIKVVNYKQLFEAADAALYDAKTAGRDCVRLSTSVVLENSA